MSPPLTVLSMNNKDSKNDDDAFGNKTLFLTFHQLLKTGTNI